MKLFLITGTGCTLEIALLAIKRFRTIMGDQIDQIHMFHGTELTTEMVNYAKSMNHQLIVFREKNPRDPRGYVSTIQDLISDSDSLLWVDTNSPRWAMAYRHAKSAMLRRNKPVLHVKVADIKWKRFGEETSYNIPKKKASIQRDKPDKLIHKTPAIPNL